MKDVIEELRYEHRRVRESFLDIGDALERDEMFEANKILGRLNAPLGAHFKFEEEALYPMLRRILGEYIDKMIDEHTEGRRSARRLAEILSYDDLSRTEKIEAGWWEIRTVFDHVANCNSLLDTVNELSEEENYQLGLQFQAAKGKKIPLIDWTKDNIRTDSESSIRYTPAKPS